MSRCGAFFWERENSLGHKRLVLRATLKSNPFPPLSIFQPSTHLTEKSSFMIHLYSVSCIYLVFCILDWILTSKLNGSCILIPTLPGQSTSLHTPSPQPFIPLAKSHYLLPFPDPTISAPTPSSLHPFRKTFLFSFAFSIHTTTWDP